MDVGIAVDIASALHIVQLRKSGYDLKIELLNCGKYICSIHNRNINLQNRLMFLYL